MNSKAWHKNTENDFTTLFLKIAKNMMALPTEKAFFETILADIGEALHASRVIITRYTNPYWSCDYIWNKDPNAPEKKENLQNINFDFLLKADDPKLDFLQGHAIVIDDISKEKDTFRREQLQAHNIFSLLTMPLFDKGKCIGFLGVDTDKEIDSWASDRLETVETLGYLIQGAMEHFRVRHIMLEEEEETHKILNTFPIPLYIVNPEKYEFIFLNKAGKELIRPESFRSKKCYEILYDFNEPCPFCSMGEYKDNKPPKVWIHRNEKFSTDFTLIESALDWGNVQDAHIVMFIDISESLALQKKQILERETFHAKSRFLANMSHELRTPVNGIEGMCRMAEKKNISPAVGNYLEKIKFLSRSLLNIINNILDFSKIEAGKMDLENAPFHLHSTLATFKENFLQEAQAKRLDASFYIAENVPPYLMGDSLRFMQIVQNLAYNAIKFTDHGSVSLTIAWENISQEENGTLTLTLKDTGIGISEEQIAVLFDLFYLGDASFTRKHGGTGIGLPVVQGLVQLMNGHISVQSKIKEGSVFTCTLPFSIAKNQPHVLEAPLHETANTQVSGTRVLLAEDNDINVIIALEALSSLGCEVTVAAHGEQVLQLVSNSEFDIILMDIEMPRMNGHEATQKLRENPKFKDLPIIAMSAHSVQEMKDLGIGEGMQDYISKPFNLQRLHQVIYLYAKNMQNIPSSNKQH